MPEADRDVSADTARFQAFAARQEEDLVPQRTRAPGPRNGPLVAVVAAAVVVAIAIGVFLIG